MRFVALIRGINVGGNRLIRMADLRSMFESAGATNVATYIQSGNVVFAHESRAPGPLLAAATKLDIMVRTPRELAAIVEGNPFPREAQHLHVLFLPSKAKVAVVATLPERYVQRGADLYVCLPGGAGSSKLAASLGKLGGTMRNWRTVNALNDMSQA